MDNRQLNNGALGTILHIIPAQLGIRALPGLDLWSERSIYIWTDIRIFDESVHEEMLTFIQWLLYCKYTIDTVPVEARLELACAEVRNLLLEQSCPFGFLRLVAFFDTSSDVKQWVNDTRPEWLKPGLRQREHVESVNKFPAQRTIGSLINEDTTVHGFGTQSVICTSF
jgi:hypothetical protein